MNEITHRIYISTMAAITIGVTCYLVYTGYSYYKLPVEERFYHEHYDWFKPSGVFGHGLGIVGTAMITFGVVIYIARKKYGFLAKQIRIKYLLEFHIFLCTLGPIMVLFHTSFKFGGVVSIAFWSMVAVVLSGVIGRFIYIRIPRNIEGRALSEEQINNQRNLWLESIQSEIGNQENELRSILESSLSDREKMKEAKKSLKASSAGKQQIKKVVHALKQERKLNSRIRNLEQMEKLFKYWHVAHKPFALIMLIIVIVHVGATLALGYKWIF